MNSSWSVFFLELRFVLPFFFNWALAFYLMVKGSRDLLNRLFIFLLVSLSLWALGDLMEGAVLDPAGALLWARISSIGWILLPFFHFYFCYTFRWGEKAPVWPVVLSFIPPAVSLYLSFSGNLMIVEMIRVWWGGTDVVGPAYWLPVVYQLTCYSVSFYFLAGIYFSDAGLPLKKVALTIFLATLVPLTIGSLTDTVLPLLGIYQVPSMAVFCTAFTAGIIFYAVRKYRFLIVDLGIAAEALLDSVSDFIIISNDADLICRVNRAALDLLGYDENELLALPVETVVKGSSFLLSKSGQKIREKGVFEEVILVTKAGNELPAGMVNIPVRGTFIRGRALVRAAADTREAKKLLDELRNRETELKGKKKELEIRDRIAMEREMKVIKLKEQIKAVKEKP